MAPQDQSRKELVMPAKLEVLGIEVVQSIQNLQNDIPLLAGKRTAVRVYVRPHDLTTDVPVTGTLALRRAGASEEVASESSVVLRRDGDHPALEEQRRSLERSLWFPLTGDQASVGRVELHLKKVTPTLHGDPDLEVMNHPPTEVDFQPGPTLRVRAVALRVRDPDTGEAHVPNAGHRYAFRSYLERAFPISQVQWSEIAIDAAPNFAPPYAEAGASPAHPGRAWQAKFDLACAHLMAIRAREVEAGEDSRTHYYGLVYHPRDFFVGAVADVPAVPRPDIVGIGPAESGDGSYAAHELAHTLGRLHPGHGPDQSPEDPDFPEDYNGMLSSAREGHHGFDVGDATQRPRVLPYDHWHDLMTYNDPQWVSAYTYQGLLERLLAEQQVARGGRPGDYLHVIGTYSFGNGEIGGSLTHVFPGSFRLPAPVEDQDRVVVIGRDDSDATLFEVKVERKRRAATDLPRGSSAFHITVPNDHRLAKLELWVDSRLVDARAHASVSPAPGATLNLDGVKVRVPSASDEDPYLLAIAWPERYDPDLAHTVQARKVGKGERWRTIATGITAETGEILLDREQLAPTSPVEVRILRADGFREAEIYQAQLPIV
jgi:hypothetical protein